jgi:hypothetical protein
MEEQQSPSIVRVATKYGLIQGVIAFLLFLVMAITGTQQSWLFSVASIVTLIVLMVLAHKAFKKSNEGVMTYGKGLGSGTLLSVIASVLTCVLVYIYVTFINPAYPAAALQAQRVALEQQGMSGAQLEQAMAMTGAMLTPMGMVITSLISGVIVGFIVALLVSLVTRVSDPRAVI